MEGRARDCEPRVYLIIDLPALPSATNWSPILGSAANCSPDFKKDLDRSTILAPSRLLIF